MSEREPLITHKELHPERNLALAIGLAVLAACQPIEARPTDETPVPTPTPEFTPTPEEEPTPTVVKRGIETIQREIGGVQGTDFLVAYKDEIQEGIQFDLENGQRWFILGVYPDLPGWEETTHFEEEYVLYENEEEERIVFLTARGANRRKDALPFYWKEETVSGPNGNFFYIKEGRMVAVAEPFVNLEENEARIVFNREAGRYEFLDLEGKVIRTIEVFNPTALPEVITPEIVDQYFVGITPQEAQRLFEETGKFVLPFDPRGIEFSILEETFEWGGYNIPSLVFRVPIGTKFIVPFTGKADIANVIRTANGKSIKGVGLSEFGLDNEGFKMYIFFVDGEFNFPEGEQDVNIGSPLFTVSSTGLPHTYAGITGGNVVIDWPGPFTLESFLNLDGKYAYIIS